MDMAKVHTGLSVTFVLTLLMTVIIGFSLNDSVCSYQKRERTGSVKFLVVAGIREPGTDGKCSNTISQTTYDNIAALEWFLTIINGKKANNVSFIPELTVGYDLYDNCDNLDLTTDLLYSGFMAGQNMSCSVTTEDTPVYIGVISLTTPEATQLISKYTNPLPVFRPLISSPSFQSRDHPNLFQTVVAFKHEALAITKMLSTTGWNYVILIHTEATNEEAEVFVDLAHAHGICLKYRGLPKDESITALYSALSQAYDKSIAVIYFGNPSSMIDFINNEHDRSRPYQSSVHWVFTSRLASHNIVVKHKVDTITYVQYPEYGISDFSTAYESIMIPNLPRKWDSPNLNPYHVTDAVMAGVYATKHVWNKVCDKLSSIENCQEFSNAIKTGELVGIVNQGLNVKDVFGEEYVPRTDYNKSIRFEENGTQTYQQLEIVRKPSYKIGNYAIDGDFVLSENVKLRDLPTSASGLDQHECLEQVNIRYSYLHGDVLLLGLFTVRNTGSSPFQCGLIRRGVNDIITVSSFFQSVLSRRKEADKYKFGAIAIDDCYNGINTNDYLTDLFSKKRIIRDPLTGSVINFDDVIVVIGALSSPVTLLVADLATSINVPMLSYSASSPDLDNKNRYPYFLRSVPSDSLQVDGMIQLLVELGVSHVGLLYIDDAYGKAGKIRLEEEARRFNICVETPIKLTQNMTNEHVETHVVNELYNQQVRVVLYFGLDTIAKQILDVIDRSNGVPFVFIASEAWGTNENLISGSTGQISKGSIVFNIDTKSNANPDYETYLQSLDDRQMHSDANRWLSKYFEDYNGCYSIDSFEKPKFPRPVICTDEFSHTLNAYTINYLYNDQRAVHTMNSVYAATESFRAVCKDNCSSVGIKKNIDRYYEAMSNAHFKDTNTKMFDEDGNGNISYTIYNIQMRTSQPTGGDIIYTSVYEPIGSYSKNGKLDLIKFPTFYDELHNEINKDEFMNINEIHCSKYQVTQTCSKVCPLGTTTSPTTAVTMETTTVPPVSDGSWKTVAISFIFGFCILVLVLIVILIRPCVIRRTSSDKGDSSGRATSVTGSHSIYDEPGSVRRKDFDNLIFMPDSASLRSHPNTSLHDMHMSGSGISLDNYPPTQYAHVRQMSNPELRFHHVRQVSNHELQSHTFDSLERPHSTLSAPAYKLNTLTRNSPAAKRTHHHVGKHKIGKQSYSPRTPHSAPVGEKKHPIIYRPRTQSSPRFRYPSTDESHYTMPTIDSNEELTRRKYGVSDDDIHGHYDDNEHSVNVDSYLELGTDRLKEEEDEPKLNYLSAKDLMTNQSDEEEDAIETSSGDETVQYTDTAFLQTSPFGGANSAAPPSGLNLNNRQTYRQPSSSLTVNSTPDNEVMNINFPPKEIKQPLKATVQTLSDNGPEMSYNRNNSITDVPDVIKHGLVEEDGVFII